MARKSKEITVQDENRDKGKTFLITEMPAEFAENWALRVFMAMARQGLDIPDNPSFELLAKLGFKAVSLMSFEEAKPLFDDLMKCVTFVIPGHSHIAPRALISEDIEEISTRFLLKLEAFKIHANFSEGESP